MSQPLIFPTRNRLSVRTMAGASHSSSFMAWKDPKDEFGCERKSKRRGDPSTSVGESNGRTQAMLPIIQTVLNGSQPDVLKEKPCTPVIRWLVN